jgi:HD-like signal output (HDOD) protein/CheY-like chemotaxis protein
MPTPLGTKIKDRIPYNCYVVDDSQIIRMSLIRVLRSESFNILGEFGNGLELIRRLKMLNEKPDFIFIDLDMPVKNGLDTIREVRPEHPDIKIVVVSMYNNEKLIQELSKLKVNGFILKPFERATIVQKLAQILNRTDLLDRTTTGYKASSISLNDLKIPTLPTVVFKVMAFDSDNPTGGSHELEQLINPDKAITANLMRIANSAYYGRAGSIATLKDAITLIGVKTVKNLVIHLSLKNSTKGLQGEVFNKYLKELPILTALVAFDISTPLGHKNIRDQLFLSGLLFKIGMSILALNFQDRYSKIIKLAETEKMDIYAEEKKEFNINSVEIGLQVFKLWNMPEMLRDSIGKQNFKADELHSVSDIVRVIRLADILSQQMVGITLPPNILELETKIFEFYKAPPELKEAFGEDYYDLIKEHPFFSMTMS